jgi:hypothetical protein
MKKNYLLFLFLFFVFLQTSFSQSVKLSVYSEVSIITVGPGDELFEAFGHSAIRIKDPVLNFDLIYNYGMFDFKAPNFYLNFVKGDLLYKVARYPFHYFLSANKKEKRWMKQQVLDLTQNEKQQFFSFVEDNVKPENSSYFYDPYFNNCATKLRDVTTIILGDKINFQDEYLKESLSLRQLMEREIPWNTWGSFGINLALGSKLDKIATSSEYMYLPDYVYLGYKNAIKYDKNQSSNLVKEERILLNFKEKPQTIIFFNPFTLFSIIMVLGILITYRDLKKKKRSKWLDFSLFIFTGIVGILIVFLWFFTNHSTAPNNFNFLWVFAPNFYVALILLNNNKKKLWVKRYISMLIIFLCVIPIIWINGIQLFPKAIIPFLILLLVRFISLIKDLLTFEK